MASSLTAKAEGMYRFTQIVNDRYINGLLLDYLTGQCGCFHGCEVERGEFFCDCMYVM